MPKFFEPDAICPHTSFDALLAAPAAERERYRLFHGHFNNHIRHFVPGPLRVLTLLRHPFERAISQYRYIVSSPTHPLHQAVADTADFGAYLRDRRLFAPNSLALALGTEFDPEAVRRRAEWRGFATGSIDALFDEETFHTSARTRHAEIAKAVLDRCVLVSLQEEMAKTASLLDHHFGQSCSGPVDILNATKAAPLDRADLPDGVLRDLADRHEHDLAIYAHGKALFERQWAQIQRAAPTAQSATAAPIVLRSAPPTAIPQRVYYMTLPWSGDVDLASQILQGFYRPSEICPAWNYDGLFALPAAALQEYSAFHGYFFWPLASFVGAPVAPVTFLTDPVERAARQYRERLADRGHKLHRLIRSKAGLGDFVRDPAAFTPNVLTLALARCFSRSDMRLLQIEADRQGVSVNDVLGEYVAAKPATILDLARAKRRLRQCAFIGFGETLDSSLVGLGRLLDWPDIALSVAPETLQAFGTRTPVDAADRAIIREVNRLDTALYEFARTLMRRPRTGPLGKLAELFGRIRPVSAGPMRATFRSDSVRPPTRDGADR
ncbi:MAG: hypothetical protein WCC64_12720 [Aliidongia sp.]